MTETAEADLVEIWSYIAAEASEPTATRFLTALQYRFDQVADWPQAGASREQLGPGLRVVFHQAYAIYYIADATQAVIVRVIHGARDTAALAERRGFGAVQ